jgi:hypothetical protein
VQLLSLRQLLCLPTTLPRPIPTMLQRLFEGSFPRELPLQKFVLLITGKLPTRRKFHLQSKLWNCAWTKIVVEICLQTQPLKLVTRAQNAAKLDADAGWSNWGAD